MHIVFNKPCYFLLILFLIISCTDKYYLNSNELNKKLVVDAIITNTSDTQQIILSYTSKSNYPIYNPASRAHVSVIDRDSNEFLFYESRKEKGVYTGIIPKQYLYDYNEFVLTVITEENDIYKSEKEVLTPCADIDSIYYEIDNYSYVNKNENPERGIAFYIDLYSNPKHSKYYLWKIEETFEYHASWPKQVMWIGEWDTLPEPDYEHFYCYKTEAVSEIFVLSTALLNENMFIKFPLHFVNNQTQRLYFFYSFYITQHSISQKAYHYWKTLEKNNENSGGLYDYQPAYPKSNITCISNPENKPLGYFGVSGVSSKRVFVNIEKIKRELLYDYNVWCEQIIPDMPTILEIIYSLPEEWPIYVPPPPIGSKGLYYSQQHCFDCRTHGGTLQKPTFYNNSNIFTTDRIIQPIKE